MERFYLLTPALLLLAVLLIGLIVFSVLTLIGRQPKLRGVKHNQFFGPFMGRYLVWILTPLEQILVGRVSANAITAFSLFLCALTGVAAATGHLVAATWMYAVGGMLDALDGRLARLSGEQTAQGALFDSVSDRWGELFVFTGFMWLLHDSPWMLAVVGAMGASQMVSYTRARAEGLGLDLKGGIMQRAERIALVCVGTFVAAWFASSPDPEAGAYVVPIIGAVMTICAVGSAGTAISRWIMGYRELSRRAAEPVEIEPTPVPATPLSFPVPQKLRESAELA